MSTIQLTVTRNDAESIINRVISLDKKFRRRALYKVGTEVSKIQLAEMRKQMKRVNRITGALAKSLGRKVSLKRSRGGDRSEDYKAVVAITGPRRGKVTKGQKFRLRFAVTRKTRAGNVPVLNKKGEQLYRQPTRYAHLAGPRRKSDFVQNTIRVTRNPVKNKMVEVLTEALANS